MPLREEQNSEMCLLSLSVPYLKQFISWHLNVNHHCCVYSKLKTQVFLSQNTTLLSNKSATCVGCYHYAPSGWSIQYERRKQCSGSIGWRLWTLHVLYTACSVRNVCIGKNWMMGFGMCSCELLYTVHCCSCILIVLFVEL